MKQFLIKIFRRNYATTVIFILTVVAFGLLWTGNKQLNIYKWQQKHLAVNTVKHAATLTANLIDELQRKIEIVLNKEQEHLRGLIQIPENENNYLQIYSELKKALPYLVTFNFLDKTGKPLLHDANSHVQSCCVDENGYFIDTRLFQPFIYKINNKPYLGILLNNKVSAQSDLFFIAIDTQIFLDLLSKIQPTQSQLIIKNDNSIPLPNFQSQQNNNFSLAISDSAEDNYIVTKSKISNGDWIIYNFVNSQSYREFKHSLIIDSILVFFAIFLLSIFLVWRLRIEELDRIALEQQKAEMLGIIAHEFRSPLTAISGSLEYLKSLGDMPENKDDREMLINMVNYNSARMAQLVNDFLLVQELESSTFQLEKKRLDIVELVQQAITANKMYGKKFGVSFNLLSKPTNALIKADAGRLEQVLTNLMSNAVKYGGENKSVDISITKSKKSVKVSVKDYGRGIPEELKAKLFEKFGVNKAFRSKKVESSGLGLSICRAIIEKHNGQLGFESYPGRGTTFYFELPRAK